ncbi:hypothetical protein ACJ41O_010230 [Fusarium nematophilum]
MFGSHYAVSPIHCGCFVQIGAYRKFLPQLQVKAHTTILATTSSTKLTQTFVNPDKLNPIHELRYIFPLYDGVSVVAFTCTIGSRVIKGVVKERQKAKQVYEEATQRGETAGLFEQSLEAADVFTTTIGNVPAGEKVVVDIAYLGELKHDAEVDGVRFTIPTQIVPRYGQAESLWQGSDVFKEEGVSFTIDAEMPDGSAIKSIQSPTHPLSVNIGTTSTTTSEAPSLRRASATLHQDATSLDKDFVVQVVATNIGEPSALLETHPTIPNQRAIMTTLVPKFKLPAEKPEIVFICDRSGSMNGTIPDLVSALKIFLKSLPVGVKFNICSFGTRYKFLWKKSKTYSQDTLDEAMRHVSTFSADFGGTQMYDPFEATFKQRYKDMNLEVFMLTDGEIWDQDRLFGLINEEVAKSKGAVRVFSLGIGSGASTSLVEGIARAGNGFAQTVGNNEKMDKKVVRMLKGALFPHITDYSLEIKYDKADTDSDDDFELVEKVIDGLKIDTEKTSQEMVQADAPKKKISLFDRSTDGDDTEMTDAPDVDTKYDHLPAVQVPRYLQTPSEIPPLFPFNRTTVYVLLSDATPTQRPKSVILKGTSRHGPLELEIPITTLTENDSVIHRLAARKEVKELEEGRGWLVHAKDSAGKLLKEKHEGHFGDLVEREAVRLGVQYQVGGKWCSFVAVEEKPGEKDKESELSVVQTGKDEPPSESFHQARPLGFSLGHRGAARSSVAGGMQQGTVMMARMAAPSRSRSDVRARRPIQTYQCARSMGGGGLFGGPGGSLGSPPPLAAPAASAFGSAAPATGGFGSASTGNPFAPGNAGSAGGGLFGNTANTSGTLGAQHTGTMPLFGSSGNPPASIFQPAPALEAGDRAPLQAEYLAQMQAAAAMPMPDEDEELEELEVQSLEKSSKKYKSKATKSSPGLFGGMFSRRQRSADWASPPSPQAADPLRDLIALQTFSGAWAWSDGLERVLGVNLKTASKDLPAGVAGHKEVGSLVATACAIVFFRNKLTGDKDTWEMVVDKAEGWLEEQIGEQGVKELEEAVAKLF